MLAILAVLWLLGYGSLISAAFSAHTVVFILALIFLL